MHGPTRSKENQDCLECDSRLHVQKTADPKTVVIIDIEAFIAKEIVLFCPQGARAYSLLSLVVFPFTYIILIIY